MGFTRRLLVLSAALVAMFAPSAASAAPPSGGANARLLVAGLEGGAGSTIGPGGALYVTETAAGRITRVDPETGATSTFASGLPKSIIGPGGPMDIAFIGRTAYVLVTLVGSDVGGSDVVGIYRVDGPNSFTIVADIGAFSINNPPHTPFFIPTGVQYSLETYRGGLLVADGHHNRVLRVTRDGVVRELIAFGNIVPTGLALRGTTIYMAEAGRSPTCPRTARSCRSERGRPLQQRWHPALACSSTWNSAAGARSTPSHKVSGTVRPRVPRRCRTPAPW